MSPTSAPSVAVVGGGIIGLATAWRLAQAGFGVAVFEKTNLGAEASWAGAGMLAPGGELEMPSPLTTLALESRRLYPAFVREVEAAADTRIDYQECGALDLAFEREEWTALEKRAEQQSVLGIRYRKIEPKQVASFWPRVRSGGLCGALFYPDDAIVNPRELVSALAMACRRRHVCLYEQTPVENVAVTPDQASLTVAGGRTLVFDAVVIAAGAWSGSIPVSGVPPLPASEPVKGHLVGFVQPDQTCNTIIRHGPTYLLQRGNGLLIAGASVEHAGWDRSIDASVAADLTRRAEFLLPHLAETTPSETWTGFRPGSDGLHLGEWTTPRLQLAYGHYRNGILLAPVTAARLTEALQIRDRHQCPRIE